MHFSIAAIAAALGSPTSGRSISLIAMRTLHWIASVELCQGTLLISVKSGRSRDESTIRAPNRKCPAGRSGEFSAEDWP
jgi:hypothetical protein